MGLLSNPKQRKRLVEGISRYNNLLCAVFYVVGVVWFVALAYQPLNAKTYFSENALLPGVVESGFHFGFDVAAYTAELKEQMKADKRNVPRDWLFAKFREIGLETYVQNYTIKYPLNIIRGQLVPGQNVYAILRARRTASTEAIVISAPFRAKTSELPKTTGGIILMLGLAKYFMRQPYWSKDIIFLVTDHEQIGMQAWLDGYHQVAAEYIRPGELPGRSGQIQAAINLEVPDGNNLKYFNAKLEGLNGQLPNLDLVNLVVRLCRKHMAEIMLHDNRDIGDWEAESLNGFLRSANTMLKSMWAQATGLASGNHGMFHRYHIEALTLEGVKKKGGRISLETTGRIVEGICRSLNNLLERFHQSFFFYILPATERYISIGLYMIPFGIMCLPCIVKAVALWVGRGAAAAAEANNREEGEKREGEQQEGDTGATGGGGGGGGGDGKLAQKLNKETLNEIVEEENDDNIMDDKPSGLVSILPLLFSSFLMSVLCYVGPDMLSSMAVPFQMNIEDGIFFGFLALFTASLMFPKMVARKTAEDKRLVFDWVLLKAVTLIFQSLVLFALSLLNISLAFFIGLVTVPVSVCVCPSKNVFLRLFQKLLLLLISPLSLLLAAAIISSLEGDYEGIGQLLVKSWTALSRGLLLTMVDKYFFGSWLFTLFSFTILPNWLSLWGISFCEAS